MDTKNRFFLVALGFTILAITSTISWAEDDDELNLSSQDKLYLSKIAREAAQLHISEGRILEPEDIPKSLLALDNKIYITIRTNGKVRGCQYGKKADLVSSTILATIKSMTDRRFSSLKDKKELENARFGFDIIKEEERLEARDIESLKEKIELGVHAIMLETDKRVGFLKGSVAITNRWNLEDMLKVLSQKAGLKRNGWKNRSVKLYKVNSISFIESDTGFTDLYRGTNYILPEDVKENQIFESIIGAANWLMNNQRDNGSYTYLYYPASNSYSGEDNILRQAGCAYAMAFLGRTLSKKEFTASSKKAIRFIMGYIRQTRNARLAYVQFDSRASLGANALLLLAIAELEEYGEFDLIAEKLANSILNMQNEDGSFRVFYRPENMHVRDEHDYYPGEAMLALARFYRREPDERFIDCLKKAFVFYSNYWREKKTTAFVPWQTSALVELCKITADMKYVEFVFQMNDWMLKKQYDESNSQYKDYIGGYRRKDSPGINTASYTEGMADAYWLARLIGDNKRAEIYGDSIMNSARFIMNLQFTKDNMYYIREPERVEGGFRESLVSNQLRNDYAQHASLALVRVLLYRFLNSDM